MDPELNPQTPQPGSHSHPDPLSGESGAHPVGAGVGAAGGGVVLGAIGSFAGPVGTAVGVAVGAVLGGLTGKGFAEGLDPTVEDAYWREHHPLQAYADPARTFEDYLPAYHTGYSGFRHGQTFEEREADLRLEYEAGPQKAEAGEEPQPGSMEYNLSTQPLHDETAPLPTPAGGPAPGSMEDNLSVRPLAWASARAAARAAYERAEATCERAEQLAAAQRARKLRAAAEGE